MVIISYIFISDRCIRFMLKQLMRDFRIKARISYRKLIEINITKTDMMFYTYIIIIK